MRHSTMRSRLTRYVAVPVAAVALVLGGVACGEDEGSTDDEEVEQGDSESDGDSEGDSDEDESDDEDDED